MNQRIDSLLRKTIDLEVEQGRFFKKSQIVSTVMKEFEPLPLKQGIDLWEVVAFYIKGRLERVLSSKDKHGLRVYECYADGSGERRWQPLRGMRVGDLRVCIAARREMIAGHERVLALYEEFEKEMIAAGANATVADVYDAAVDKMAAAG